ncbi:ADP-ribose pyrophosphatase YjhB (NUDIX family) [Haloactinopolyspora alba]|uniref:ADP-ribose pyrophosphatase YjhB (NUDIX family) n=1 Tax=Haloactinopolyspora alba TaxID=648780 RepID=A0A2P8DIA0_9ACTN|nr:NUDIX domain-containing protein [Haloactinopolyspora alba]PSK96942.1 ADP-ribose pyrophosphatase YjhB (NUDIX family) [Haloactinopolyspora alba]
MSAIDPDTVFAEWRLADDGVWERDAARVIVVDAARRVLLVGVDVDDSARARWFTPGGGVEPRESERTAASRELFEESGLDVPPDDLAGPVAVRDAEFTYFGRPCRQHEALFHVRLDGGTALRTDGWTEVERASVADIAWWDVDELSTTETTIYPPALASLVTALLEHGWDGATRTVD